MRRALIIANEAYADPQFASLPGTVADADSLREVLENPAIGAFDDVRVLRNRTVHDVGRAVAVFFHNTEPDDLLLLHISAHGLKDAAGDLFFAARDSEHDSHLIRATALSAADIRHEMADSRAKQIVVLLDCCYSGAFARDERARGAHDADLTGPFRGRGHVVITSCAGTELSFERDGQGVFTRAVVDGLRTGRADRNGDGIVDTDELYRYVDERVHEVSRRQRPTLSVHRKQGVIRVAWAGREAPPPPDDGPLHRWRRLVAAVTSRPATRGALPRRVVVPILAVWALLCASAGYSGPVAAVGADCFQPPQVRVATSAAGLEPYREVADAFERWSARQHRGCPLARLYLYPAAADDVRAGIGADWDSSGAPGRRYLQDVGPHPDLWLPESAVDVTRLGPAGAGVVDEVNEIAASPLVLGVPQAQVAAGGAVEAARRMGRTWRELFRDAAGATAQPVISGGEGVVRADPAVSAPARLATYALYGDERGLASASTARQDVERWVDEALDAGSYPIGDDLAVLCRQRTRATAPTGGAGVRIPAVVLTEQALVRYNQGRPLGAGCPAQQPPPATERLQAFYPSDSPLLFLTVARLRWPAAVQSPAVRAAASTFARWLVHEEEGQQALLRVGLRPPGVTATTPVVRANGALFDWPFARVRPLRELVAGEQDRVREVYRRAHRPGRVLVALDASGSMREPSEDRRRSRFEVAVDGVGRAVERVGGRDEFGLRTFSTVAANARPIVPIGPPGATVAGSLRAAVARIRPAGDTPLHQTIRQGVAQLRGGGGDPLRALVVVTDGQDTSGRPPPTVAELSGVRLYVLAVGDADCAGSPLDRLAQGTGGDCYDTRTDRLDPTLDRLFTALWKGAD
ncbi:caspase, EACC1-associated type [Micromonospora humi]|uniref:Extracellular solute-binding protein n=1 Tax=Micromonospora humi TaxID=745366 RepID=A0A1C5IXG1_9ACTN|nr:caspase family protein [Micromonospora humi]SCG63010.1 extracellular solute-binding protein [Micromonospora humi]